MSITYCVNENGNFVITNKVEVLHGKLNGVEYKPDLSQKKGFGHGYTGSDWENVNKMDVYDFLSHAADQFNLRFKIKDTFHPHLYKPGEEAWIQSDHHSFKSTKDFADWILQHCGDLTSIEIVKS